MIITRGKQPKAKKVLLYGPEGIGKTTLARQFPTPLFLDSERGTGEYEVDRTDVRSWSEITKALHFVQHANHQYRSVVLDTIDSALPLLNEEICREHRVHSIGDLGYGKGYAQVSEKVGALLEQCNQIVDRGIHVLFLAHSQVRRVEQPDLPEGYDKYELRLPERVSGPLKTAVDAVLFANYRVTMVEDKGRHRATGGKERVLHASHSPTHDAKNRCGIPDRSPFAIESLAPLFAGIETVPTLETGTPALQKLEEQRQVAHPLDHLLAGVNEMQITAFLKQRGQIKDGETYRNLSETYVKRVLQSPQAFLKCALA